MLGTLPRALGRALILTAGLALFAPPVAGAADELALIDKTEQLGPGITLRHLKTVDSTGWYDHQILTADLSNAAVKSDSLWAGAVAKGGPLSEAADHAGAVAGVNADFFDIGNSTAALGGQIMGGNLLKSPDGGTGWNHAGVGKDGIGRLVDMTLEASASLKGTTHRVLTLNAANGGGVPAGSMLAFNSAWGTYSRARGLTGVTNTAEVLVRENKVVSVGAPGAGEIPADGFVLVGRDAAADAIRALAPGDDVTLTYGLKDDIAKNMQFTVGGNQPLVRNGQPLPDSQLETAIHPRTAIGFKDGGKTLLLVTADGRQDPVLGVSLRRLARFMADLGAENALNLDGGGSTTMVARPLGEDKVTIRNSPSDGGERFDPNGVGVFVAAGSGVADELVITPAEPRVFPGLHRTLKVKAVDDHDTPVATPAVTWTGAADGVVTAPEDATGKLTVRAAAGAVSGETEVRVLGKLDTLELSSQRLAFADASPSAARVLRVTGRDGEGFTAPLELTDLELDYDRSLLDIEQVATGLRLTPKTAGGTTLVVRAAGKTAKLPITIGVSTENVYTFDHADEPTRWNPNGTAPATQQLSMQDGRLKLTYQARRNMGITWRTTATRPQAPGAPLRIRVRLWSQNTLEYSNITYVDAGGTSRSPLGSQIRPGWNTYEWTLPAGVRFPIRVSAFQVIETNVSRQADGVVIFDKLEVDNAVEVPSPPLEPLREDPMFSIDGTTNGKDDWSFATLSDIQFTAASPELAKTGIAALNRIRKSNAELVVLNGDITDLGAPADLDLARTTLETGGCDLIPAGGTPDDNPDTIPCYYVPGNHESYTAAGQGTLDNWVAEFGQPYRYFDHKGTRFILLNSTLGTLRTSSWAQLPMLDEALRDAATNDAVDNVMVFAHHPVDDPGDPDASQLGDRTEVALVEKLLTDFRETSGKGVGMVGSHAQIADVHRIEGVPYTVLPSSGKAPYGTPDRGGFTGWMRWSVDRDASAKEQWITADVRAFAQSATLTAPEALEVGDTAQIEGSIVQPSGVLPGNRVVPLRYPMSVRWSGSDNLAFGTDKDAAKAAGKAAIFDTRTRKLTALGSGEVVLSATTDSMREYTGPASLEPVVVSKVIRTQVTRVAEETEVGGTVPQTLSLTLGAPASFGAFTPGVAREYEASTIATVVSTAGDAGLTVSDPSSTAKGHLVNGSFSLPQPLQGLGTVKTWGAPVSNESVTVPFKQAVGATDALRTGAYSKALTFTLSTTTP